MRILGIETSCDETGAAVIEGRGKESPVSVLSQTLATSLAKHAQTGGIIPEVAAREQVKFMLPVVYETLSNVFGAGVTNQKPPIDAIAVTHGPGLIGSLLVGVETAKTLALLWNVPLIPVNHLYGHIYANWIGDEAFPAQHIFPAISLVVSGGHTDIILLKNHGHVSVLGGTRDDAAGEAFDKIGRLLGLPYPAGPVISQLAKKGNRKAFLLPRPMWDSKDYDFSFSGLKTAVLNLVKKNGWDFAAVSSGNQQQLFFDICASVEKAIVDILLFKTLQAVKAYEVRSLLLAGGVAANTYLREQFEDKIAQEHPELFFHCPPASLCTDNGAMIAAAAFYMQSVKPWQEVTVQPQLYY